MTTRTTTEMQASRNDSGVVENEKISGNEQIGQIENPTMFRSVGSTIDEKTSGVARFAGNLGDARVGKVVVEIRESHESRPIRADEAVCRVP